MMNPGPAGINGRPDGRERRQALPSKLRRTTVLFAFLWTVFVGAVFLGGVYYVHHHARELAIKEARTHFRKDNAFRYWAASHGGVYVPADERTPPNPYLEGAPERDITTPSGRELTLMNPAYMVRQMNEEFSEYYGVAGHITSLKLHRPDNKPDPWERKALLEFEKGKAEALEFTEINGTPYLRLMKPVLAEKPCLKCHGYQGYKVGDIRGGVSVSLPLEDILADERREINLQFASFGSMWIIGLVGLFIGYRGLDRLVFERLHTEKSLSKSEERYRALFSYNPEATFTLGKNGRFSSANSAAEKLSGYRVEELLALQSSKALVPKGEKDKVKGYFAAALKGKAQWFDTRIISRSGQTLETRMTLAPFTVRGRVMGVYGIARDVTEQKKAEENLKRSEQKTRAIIATVGEGVIVIGSDSVIHMASQELLNIFGYAEEELIGESVTRLMPEKYRNRHIDGVRKYLAGGPTSVLGRRVDLEGLRKNGEAFPLELRIEETREDGGGRFFTGAIRDLTERKMAEKALRESEERFRRSFEFAAIGKIIGGKDGRFLEVNRSFCNMLGYTKEELLEMSFEDITYPGDLHNDDHLVSQILKGDINYFNVEKRYVTREGGIVWGLLSVSMVHDDEGNPLYFLDQVQDITDRKKAEQALLEAKEMAEEATKLKDKFVSLVAHDLRSPFSSMLGLLGLIRGDREKTLTEKQGKLLKAAIESGEHMSRMVDELLDISRLQTGNIVPRKEWVDVHRVIMEAFAGLAAISSEKGIEMANEAPEGAMVYADPGLYGEVIQNVVSNAVKFCSHGDRVTVYMPEEGGHTVAVRDTGVGIRQDALPNLFKHEEKTTTEGTAGERGTGLGLPYCHEIVSAHGGSLTVESIEGEGSVFYITLPPPEDRTQIA